MCRCSLESLRFGNRNPAAKFATLSNEIKIKRSESETQRVEKVRFTSNYGGKVCKMKF